MKKTFSKEDIEVGDVIQFYNSAWRFDKVKNIINHHTGKTTIVTERLGKVSLGVVRDVLVYEGKRTVRKFPVE